MENTNPSKNSERNKETATYAIKNNNECNKKTADAMRPPLLHLGQYASDYLIPSLVFTWLVMSVLRVSLKYMIGVSCAEISITYT